MTACQRMLRLVTPGGPVVHLLEPTSGAEYVDGPAEDGDGDDGFAAMA